MKFLVTFYFWSVFLLTAPVGALMVTALAAVTASFDKQRTWVHHFIARWTHGYLAINPFWRVRVENRQLLPQGPCVLLANHQSMADVVVVMGLFHPFKFVSKASLFKLPLLGWVMNLARYVAIERGSLKSTQRMLDICRDWLRQGTPVLIFPEGTYSTHGRLLPFKRGAFRLALQEKVPLVPVVLQGTQSLVEGDGPWLNPTCQISVQVLPAIDTSTWEGDENALSRKARQVFEEALAPGSPMLENAI